MRRHMLKLASLLGLALAVAFFMPQRAAADDDDPPGRVARLSYTHGAVSFNPAGTDDWVTAVHNRPITTGDKLWTDNGARAELHIGSAAIRLSGNTGFSFLNLTDNVAQIRVTEGTINIRVRSLDNDETFEVDTPNLAFSILGPGRYRINVNDAGDTTAVVVRDGEGEVTGGGSAYTIHRREVGTFSGYDQLDADVQSYWNDDDDFDHWCFGRDRREDRSISSRYVSRDVIGYEDLDDYGGWRPVPEYGTVWFPHTVIVGWAPYRYGHWVWISPWGWTWVDDAPWGFAPFHYGRWVVVGGVWGWVPCPPRPAVMEVAYVRPVYAPALVAWVGGPHFAVGIGVGGGGGVGVAWFPLGPREVYVPSYPVSRTYVTNVNVTNTTVNNTYVTNVYNTTVVNNNNNVHISNIKYVNQGVPGAVTATSHETFTSAQPVGKHMIKVDEREVVKAPVAIAATPVAAPPKQAVLGAAAPAAVKPPAVLQNRAVVAKATPPPPPAPFERQQQAIKANGGRPIPISEIRQQQRESVQAAPIPVKIAPPARPTPPQNTQVNRPGDIPNNNPSNRPGPPSNAEQSQMRRGNQPIVENDAPPANQDFKPGNKPGNPPSNAGNPKTYNDRPPSVRPNNSGDVNPQLDQKRQQQQEQVRQKPDQERQGIEQRQQQIDQKHQQQQEEQLRQKQDQERQRIEQRQQQIDQKHQQEQEQLRQKQDQERQRIEQQQQQERQRLVQKNADERRQQQMEQKHQQQLEQVERKHDQEQQKQQQKQQQERQKEKESDKPKEKDDKPSHGRS